MKKLLVLLLLIFAEINGYAQNIRTNVFDNLEYESENGNYEAELKKNIFDDLIFTDNNDNEITLKKKYLDLMYSGILENSATKFDLFTYLISEYQHFEKQEVSYAVGFRDKIVIEGNNEEATIDKGISGELTYEVKNEKATLKKDIFNNWIYEDSHGNELKISSETWEGLIERYGTKENIFHHLIYELLKI